MGWWMWLNYTGRIGYANYVHHPEHYEGQQVVLSLVKLVERVDDTHHRVAKGSLLLDVYGPLDQLSTREEASIGVRFEDGRMRIEWAYPKTQRKAKVYLGLVGLVFLSGALPMWFRWTPQGWTVRG
jgi:hypothetical protein